MCFKRGFRDYSKVKFRSTLLYHHRERDGGDFADAVELHAGPINIREFYAVFARNSRSFVIEY